MRFTKNVQCAAALVAAGLITAGCGAPGGGSDPTAALTASAVPKKPSKPVTLNILDVAGNKQLTGSIFSSFEKEHPDVISHVTWETAGAPDMAGKVKAQQQAGNLQIDLVLTGTDGLAAGIDQKLFVNMKKFSDRLPNMANYQKPAAKMQKLAKNQGVELVYYPSGPLLEYNPAKVKNPPKSAKQLLAWAKAHPGKFGYAQPANSGPGRTWLMGLPYILGDKDPKDPVNGWSKTWNYLQKLGKYIKTYPTGTSVTMNNLKTGAWDMAVTTTGWDINPRALHQVPKNFKVAALDTFDWVADAQYAVVPKGVSADKMSAILQVLNYALSKKQQAKTYDDGYFYPGPAVKGVTLDMAPAKSQKVIKEYGRPEYADMIKSHPIVTPISAKSLVKAFDMWDRKVGGGKAKSQ